MFYSLWFPHCVFVDLFLFNCSVMSSSLQPYWLQHTRLPCCSPAPGELMNPCSLLRVLSIDSVMPSNHLILCVPFFCLQSFSASGSFPISQFFVAGGQTGASASAPVLPTNECSGLISFRIDWFDLLAVQGILKSLLQHHGSKASILQPPAFFMVQLSYPYMTTEKP